MIKLFSTKKFRLLSLLAFLTVGLGAAFLFQKNNKVPSSDEEKDVARNPVSVKVQSIQESRSYSDKIKYPGVVSGMQEVTVRAGAAGVVQQINFDLGDQVSKGRVVAVIDDQGVQTEEGDNDFRSAQVRQLEKAVEQAEESYDQAKRNYKAEKTAANKTAKDIAELQYESAKVTLDDALNSRVATAAISGKVVNRLVSVGETVSFGQVLAIISADEKRKVQFYVSSGDLKDLKIGQEITVGSGGKGLTASIVNLSPKANETTGRFLVEASLGENEFLLLGSVVDVWVEKNKTTSNSKEIILHLSAINTGQNRQYIFLAENDQAKDFEVKVLEVEGEIALVELAGSLDDKTLVVVEGNKLLTEGDKLRIN